MRVRPLLSHWTPVSLHHATTASARSHHLLLLLCAILLSDGLLLLLPLVHLNVILRPTITHMLLLLLSIRASLRRHLTVAVHGGSWVALMLSPTAENVCR